MLRTPSTVSRPTKPRLSTLHHRMINPGIYVKRYFQGESNFLPYIKGQVGLDVVKFTTKAYDPNFGDDVFRELSYQPALSLGLGGGVLYYTFDYGGVYAEANYHTAFTKNVVGTYYGRDQKFGTTTSIFDIHAGIKVFFGGD